jgi:hypothetical protein
MMRRRTSISFCLARKRKSARMTYCNMRSRATRKAPEVRRRDLEVCIRGGMRFAGASCTRQAHRGACRALQKDTHDTQPQAGCTPTV